MALSAVKLAAGTPCIVPVVATISPLHESQPTGGVVLAKAMTAPTKFAAEKFVIVALVATNPAAGLRVAMVWPSTKIYPCCKAGSAWSDTDICYYI
jgi:hypothetical protein